MIGSGPREGHEDAWESLHRFYRESVLIAALGTLIGLIGGRLARWWLRRALADAGEEER